MIEIKGKTGVELLTVSNDTSLALVERIPNRNDERYVTFSVHNCKNVEYTPWSKLTDTCDSRDMQINTDNGDRITITLFRNR